MLKKKITSENVSVKQADNDADVLIVETAIEQFNSTNSTILIGEDVDLLVLLSKLKIIYFLKPGKAQQESKIYSFKSLSAFSKCQNHSLFLHAALVATRHQHFLGEVKDRF